MDWKVLVTEIFEICIIPLLGILTTFLVALIKTKMKEIQDKTDNVLADKYLSMLTETISACVLATNQTYVDALKEKDLFDAEAQKEAFKKTYEAVLNILSDDAKTYLTSAYGDLAAFITSKIEAEIQLGKYFILCMDKIIFCMEEHTYV